MQILQRQTVYEVIAMVVISRANADEVTSLLSYAWTLIKDANLIQLLLNTV